MNLRNNQNIQALALVAAFVAIVAIGLSFLRPPTPEFANLDVELSGSNLSITVPHCDMSRYPDKFFLHIYTKDNDPAAFVGRDFDLASAPHSEAGAGKQCVVERPIDVPEAKRVEIGQFNMPGGRCCTILWTRNFSVKP